MAAKMAAAVAALALLGTALGGGSCRGGSARPGDPDSCSLSLPLEHSFELDDAPRFQRRGVLQWSPGGDPPLTLSQRPLSPRQLQQLRAVAAQGGWYRVRVPSNPPGDPGPPQFVSSFLPARSLLRCQLSDQLSLHVDVAGNVVALGVVAPPGPCGDTGDTGSTGEPEQFNTSLTLRAPLPAATPETAAFLRQLEQDRAQRGRNPQEHKSFFARYWMYIIPIVLFLMMSGAPDSGGGQGGGAAAGGGGAGGR